MSLILKNFRLNNESNMLISLSKTEKLLETKADISDIPTNSDFSLNGLSEKSYNSLTDKPDLSLKADLVNGLVPTNQLPSYIDEIVEGYIDLENNKFYSDPEKTIEINVESGKIYVDLTTNLQYRFSGSVFVVTSSSLALGETADTAFPGNRGKALEQNKVDKVTGKGLSTEDYTTNEKSKLSNIESNAQVNIIETVKVDNTALTITDKTINIDLSGKVDKVSGKGLSTNDYTDIEKNKLADIESNAQVNIIEDVKINGTSLTITNKSINVSIPTNGDFSLSGLSEKSYNSLTDKPIIDSQLNSLSTNAVQNSAITAEFNNYILKTGGTINGVLMGSSSSKETIYVGETREIKTLLDGLIIANYRYKLNNGYVNICLDNYKADGVTQAEYYLDESYTMYCSGVLIKCTDSNALVKPKIVGTNSVSLTFYDNSSIQLYDLEIDNICLNVQRISFLAISRCVLSISTFNDELYQQLIGTGANSYSIIIDSIIDTSRFSTINNNYYTIIGLANDARVALRNVSIIGNKTQSRAVSCTVMSSIYIDKYCVFTDHYRAITAAEMSYVSLGSDITFTNVIEESSPVYNTIGNINAFIHKY